uniref:Uncharacterized protein n=1 Tax=Myotis myotis TaxID=51298 RepID=A0A7J7SRH7_MYOMY|nr:hypothetical protein mMyoMyo1_009370 [Myotis myotis]
MEDGEVCVYINHLDCVGTDTAGPQASLPARDGNHPLLFPRSLSGQVNWESEHPAFGRGAMVSPIARRHWGWGGVGVEAGPESVGGQVCIAASPGTRAVACCCRQPRARPGPLPSPGIPFPGGPSPDIQRCLEEKHSLARPYSVPKDT